MEPTPMAVSPASINQSAGILTELAGLLTAGRPDEELCTRAVEPAVDPAVGAQVRQFAQVARDEYQDAVALIAALSTKVEAASGVYAGADTVGQLIDGFLTDSTFEPPAQGKG